MSLINDALKRAREVSTSEAPAPEPPRLQSLQPVAHSVGPVTGWFVAVAIIFLIIAGIFFVGFAMTHKSVKEDKVAAVTTSPAPVVEPVSPPAPPLVETKVPPAAVVAPPAQPAPPPVIKPVAKFSPEVHPEPEPKLQGIFYSPTAPAAIVNGKTVGPGEQILQYHVVEITKLTVTLVGADGKTVKLSMDN